MPYAKLDDPQSLNLYSYVQNNPLSTADADGHTNLLMKLIQNKDSLWNIFNIFNRRSKDKSQKDESASSALQNDQNKNQQDQTKPSGSNTPPSWDPSKPLPKDPSGLGSGWKEDKSHRSPNDDRYINDKGDKLDWHKGMPGKTGEKGKDHWHWLPGGNKEDKHYNPGDTIKKYGPAVGIGVAVGGFIRVIVTTAPEWGPALAPALLAP